MRIGIKCPVDHAEITDESCLACRASGCARVVRDCGLTYEMLAGMTDQRGRATAHVSATMLTSSCPRRTYLERSTDYYADPEKLFPAWRGTMGHLMTEAYPQPGAIYEQRFETKILLPSGKELLITGQIDKLDIQGRHIEDFKTKADAKLLKLREPEEAHIWQLNIYRWLVYTGWPQKKVAGLVPNVAAEIEVHSLKLVYWSMTGTKPLIAPIYDLEEVEAYVIARADALQNLPSVPGDLDPYKSVLCRDWCPVRQACLDELTGF